MPDRDPDEAPAAIAAARIAALLVAIEREPVPKRLLELARALQAALRVRAPSGRPTRPTDQDD